MKKILKVPVLFLLFLVFGLSISGCDLESNWNTDCTYVNESSYTLEVTMEAGMGWSPAEFTLRPGESQLVGTTRSKSPVRATYTNDHLVKYTSSFTGTYVDSYTVIFTNR